MTTTRAKPALEGEHVRWQPAIRQKKYDCTQALTIEEREEGLG